MVSTIQKTLALHSSAQFIADGSKSFPASRFVSDSAPLLSSHSEEIPTRLLKTENALTSSSGQLSYFGGKSIKDSRIAFKI